MADVPTRDVTLREMVEAMSRYKDEETFRWFAKEGENLRVTMKQARAELILLMCCECDEVLDDQGACPNEECCEWRGLAEPVKAE